jgi:hypothetical protein
VLSTLSFFSIIAPTDNVIIHQVFRQHIAGFVFDSVEGTKDLVLENLGLSFDSISFSAK